MLSMTDTSWFLGATQAMGAAIVPLEKSQNALYNWTLHFGIAQEAVWQSPIGAAAESNIIIESPLIA